MGEKEGRREGEGRGEERWRCVEVKGKGVKKNKTKQNKKNSSDVFISSLVCLVAPGAGFSPRPHLAAHRLVTAKCVKTPPTERRQRGKAEC